MELKWEMWMKAEVKRQQRGSVETTTEEAMRCLTFYLLI